MIETHRSFSNMWECDENDHMNVQFFIKRFEEAALVYGSICGEAAKASIPIKSRHIRFHKEIRAGESLQIFSGHVRNGAHKNFIAHRMINSVTGILCTTAFDECDTSFASSIFVHEEQLHDVRPRGLSDSEDMLFDAEAMVSSGQAMVANYNVIRSHDLDQNDNFLTSRIVSMFTDGAPHVWEKAGVTTDWLNRNGFGRVAVEMRLTPMKKPKVGEALRLVSRVGEQHGRTFRLDHQIEAISDQRLIATGSVRGLVMDLATRKAVQLPENFTAKFSH